MTDETIRVVYDVTQKGMENVRRLVGDIRKELGNSGVDTGRFEKRLEGLEKVVTQVTNALKNVSTSSKSAGTAGAAAAAQVKTEWQKAQQEIAEANKEYGKFKRGQVTGEGGGKSLGEFSPQTIARLDAIRKAQNADVIKDADAAAKVEARRTAKEVADKEAAARKQLQIDRDYERQASAIADAGAKEDARRVQKRLADEQAAAKARLEGIRQANREEEAFNKKVNAGVTRAGIGATKGANYLSDAGAASKRAANKSLAAEWDREFQAATISANKFRHEQDGIISARYALYDIASTYGVIGTALAGIAIYAAVVGAQFQAAFTNVERTLAEGTTPAAVEAIRESLVRLSGQIPLTFDQLTQIATIGNQMGIAEEDIVSFTGTIARFASVSGMSIDAVTKAFGGFAAQTGLDPKYFENLGASIAKVGIDSNATEEQIVSLLREITAGARGAGFAADQIVGLSGTLAGLQIAPERARGALTTYFNTLNKAVADGGEDLQNFATVVGLTSEELENMVRNNEGADVLRRFLEGLNGSGSVEVTQALDALNLSQLRVSDTFRRLSNDLTIYDRDQANANSAFLEGAELNRQYAMTVDDLASQWVIFINNLNAVVDAITGGAIPGIAALFTAVNSVLMAFTEWLGNNKWAGMLLAFGATVVGVLGGILLFRAASMAATASLLAFRLLAQQAGGAAILASGGIRGLTGALLGVRGAAVGAAGGVNFLRGSIRALLASTGIGLLVTLGGSLIDSLIPVGGAAEDAAISLDEYNQAIDTAGALTEDTAGGADKLADSLGGSGGVGDAAESTAAKVRTLVDYVNDLNGVFRRSSDIRFGSTAAMDEITLKWLDLNEAAAEYQRQIRTLTADRSLQSYWLGIAELYDDQVRAAQIREDIAKIDDEMATAQAGANTELTGNTRAAIQNRQTMRGLVGQYEDYVSALAAAGATQGEIQATLGLLNTDFQTQATALGFAGGELVTYGQRFGDLSTIVTQMPRDITVNFSGDPALQAMNEFAAKAAESAAAAGTGAGNAFGDGFDSGLGGITDPVAIDEWVDPFGDTIEEKVEPKGKDAGKKIVDSIVAEPWKAIPIIGTWIDLIFGDALRKGGEKGQETGASYNAGMGVALSTTDPITARIYAGQAAANTAARTVGDSAGKSFLAGMAYTISSNPIAGPSKPGSRGREGGGEWATGGYTGAGHWLTPAGVVHKGEYVIPKKHVNQSTGLPDPSYVASLQRSKSAGPGYAMGGHVSGGGFGGAVELGPASLQYLGQALSVRLGVDSRELAVSSSKGDKKLAWAGSN